MTYFFIIGSVLGVFYTLLTTSKRDYREMDNLVIVIIIMILIVSNWAGLIMSIASDINAIKEKLTD